MMLTESDIFRSAVIRISGAASEEFETESFVDPKDPGSPTEQFRIVAWRSKQTQPTTQQIRAELRHASHAARVLDAAKIDAKRQLAEWSDRIAKETRDLSDVTRDLVRAVELTAKASLIGTLTGQDRAELQRLIAKARKWSTIGGAQETAETAIDSASTVDAVEAALVAAKDTIKSARTAN